jgi:hypothetical protein
MWSKNAAVVAAAVVLAGAAASTGIASADPPAPPPAPKTAIDHDGTYTVGTDIAPGTYSSAGPVGNGTCYWKRLSSPNGKDVIDNAMSRKPQVVEIDPSDRAFKTDGCQPWQKTDSVSADAATPPLLSEAQLRADIGDLNARARQFGAGQLPPP